MTASSITVSTGTLTVARCLDGGDGVTARFGKTNDGFRWMKRQRGITSTARQQLLGDGQTK